MQCRVPDSPCVRAAVYAAVRADLLSIVTSAGQDQLLIDDRRETQLRKLLIVLMETLKFRFSLHGLLNPISTLLYFTVTLLYCSYPVLHRSHPEVGGAAHPLCGQAGQPHLPQRGNPVQTEPGVCRARGQHRLLQERVGTAGKPTALPGHRTSGRRCYFPNLQLVVVLQLNPVCRARSAAVCCTTFTETRPSPSPTISSWADLSTCGASTPGG